jgi:hypothetical protein
VEISGMQTSSEELQLTIIVTRKNMEGDWLRLLVASLVRLQKKL